MKKFHFKKLLQNDGWHDNVLISVDGKGLIQEINYGSKAPKEAEVIAGIAVPGFQNAHSHAFQYAMAGLAERHENAAANDDFWSWRETMYQIALTMSPDDLEHVAAQLYAEMVRHGYTHVAEFHYLHHDQNGEPYQNLAEHGERLIGAAKTAGINITLVPMFYQKGGFGQAPQERQRRFISKDVDAYFKLLEASKAGCQAYEGASIAWGIHSLRAVDPDLVKQAVNLAARDLPFHIHIAEQKKEVEDALAYLRARPVQWLLENVEVNERFHLVHATHLDDEEVKGIAQKGAYVVLCPSTEGNLGDGIFRLKEYQPLGGKWSIGTDSHIGLNPLEELRILDYGQRLISHQRNTFTTKDESDSGKYGFNQALLAGRKAMGNHVIEYFSKNEPLNAVVYRNEHPLIQTTSSDNLMSSIVYTGDASLALGTIVNGSWVVKEQQHINREAVTSKFIHTIKKLTIR